IQDGVYTMQKQMSAASAVELMLSPKSRNTLIIPEGRRNAWVYDQIDKRLGVKAGTFDMQALAAAHDVLSALGKSDELLDIALKLEEHALSDDYFVSRNLYPNVDFYTGLIYRAMGFPTEMFTVLFALGRLPGWIAQ
ncbi:hypothetical protein ADL35_05655, partial [Streptomyces sp. NRRL WC-3753]